jgi:hypothetical protein
MRLGRNAECHQSQKRASKDHTCIRCDRRDAGAIIAKEANATTLPIVYDATDAMLDAINP